MNDKPSWWDRPTTIKIETRSFKSNVQIYNKKYESSKNSSPSMKLSKSPHLKIQRPKTTSHFQRHRRGTSEQHARVILATRERGTQSVASQRYSDLQCLPKLRFPPFLRNVVFQQLFAVCHLSPAAVLD